MLYIEETIVRLKMSNKPVALIDIDGVMQDNRHRLHHICEVVDGVERKKRKCDWEAYTAQAHLDAPGAFCDVVRSLSVVVTPVYLTARADSTNDNRREVLAARLAELTGDGHPIVIKRAPLNPGEGFSSAVDYKRAATYALMRNGLRILFAVDDSHVNCLMFKELGIPTLRLYNHLTPHNLFY